MPPFSSDLKLASAEDFSACKAMIEAGSRSFAVASRLLPKKVRTPAFALYAFCRISDDLVDVDGGRMDAVNGLRDRLAKAYAGCPVNSPIDRALADTLREFQVPKELPEALLEGLEWDVRGVACETLGDLQSYAARVAGSVGAMMALLMGVRDASRLARAADLGVAMQLTNIARDVGEDARSGRLYLPRAWLRAEGLEPDEWMKNPIHRPEIAAVVDRLLQVAATLYERADSGIARLPASCRAGIFAARHIYCAIGKKVAERSFDSVSSRARVDDAAKLLLVMRSVVQSLVPQWGGASAPALPETAYLVNAVSWADSAWSGAESPSPDGVAGKVIWVAELFANLDKRRARQLFPVALPAGSVAR